MDTTIRKSTDKLHSVFYNSLYEFQTTKRFSTLSGNSRKAEIILDRTRDANWIGARTDGHEVIKKALLGDKVLYNKARNSPRKIR